jgi:hypothetical protein
MLFLFPTVERVSTLSSSYYPQRTDVTQSGVQKPSEFFCVEALGSALEIILFKSSKSIGLAFMEELCQADDTERCADWHRKLRDRKARKGVPPGLLAFAAAQVRQTITLMLMRTLKPKLHRCSRCIGPWRSYIWVRRSILTNSIIARFGAVTSER